MGRGFRRGAGGAFAWRASVALDGALARALADGDLAVVEADCLEREVAAFAGGERVELGAAVQPVGDPVVELPGGRGGRG